MGSVPFRELERRHGSVSYLELEGMPFFSYPVDERKAYALTPPGAEGHAWSLPPPVLEKRHTRDPLWGLEMRRALDSFLALEWR